MGITTALVIGYLRAHSDAALAEITRGYIPYLTDAQVEGLYSLVKEELDRRAYIRQEHARQSEQSLESFRSRLLNAVRGSDGR